MPNFAATRSGAWEVGMERATPAKPSLYPGTKWALAVMMAKLSLGVTKKLLPKIILRSPSPSDAAPKSGAFSPNIISTKSWA